MSRYVLAPIILLAVEWISPVVAAAQQSQPQPPVYATAESCGTYRGALAAQIQAIYQRTSRCMRKGPNWSTFGGSEDDRRPWCTPGPPPRLRAEVTAYPDCAGEEETLCAAYEAQRTEVPACFDRVRSSDSDIERRLVLANDMMDIHVRFKRAESIIQHPELFLREVVLPRLPSHVKAKLDMYEGMVGTDAISFNGLKPLPATVDISTFGMPRQLSKSGTGIMQDLYNYLFSGRLETRNFVAGTPSLPPSREKQRPR